MSDYNSSDQMYGWNGSAQFWQTWNEHLAQLRTTLEAEIINTVGGFNLLEPDNNGVVTWDNSSKKLTITPKAGHDLVYWVNGKQFIVNTPITSVALPNASGSYYFYIEEDGTMNHSMDGNVGRDVIYHKPITGLVYYDSVLQKGLPFKEQHGIHMSGADHEMDHLTIGARYSSGLALLGLEDGEETFEGMASGTTYDEDVRHEIDLQPTIPFMWREDAGGEWKLSTPDNEVTYRPTAGNAVWNYFNGSVWSLKEADNAHDYLLHFVVVMPTLDGYPQAAIILDQVGYSSRSNARNNIENAKKDLILSGLPSPELVFVGVYIGRKNGDLENLADGSVYFDLRGTSARGAGGASSPSNEAADVAVNTTNFDWNLGSGDSNLQTALESIDEISNIKLLTSDPASPRDGLAWLNVMEHKLKIKTATGIEVFSAD